MLGTKRSRQGGRQRSQPSSMSSSSSPSMSLLSTIASPPLSTPSSSSFSSSSSLSRLGPSSAYSMDLRTSEEVTRRWMAGLCESNEEKVKSKPPGRHYVKAKPGTHYELPIRLTKERRLTPTIRLSTKKEHASKASVLLAEAKRARNSVERKAIADQIICVSMPIEIYWMTEAVSKTSVGPDGQISQAYTDRKIEVEGTLFYSDLGEPSWSGTKRSTRDGSLDKKKPFEVFRFSSSTHPKYNHECLGPRGSVDRFDNRWFWPSVDLAHEVVHMNHDPDEPKLERYVIWGLQTFGERIATPYAKFKALIDDSSWLFTNSTVYDLHIRELWYKTMMAQEQYTGSYSAFDVKWKNFDTLFFAPPVWTPISVEAMCTKNFSNEQDFLLEEHLGQLKDMETEDEYAIDNDLLLDLESIQNYRTGQVRLVNDSGLKELSNQTKRKLEEVKKQNAQVNKLNDLILDRDDLEVHINQEEERRRKQEEARRLQLLQPNSSSSLVSLSSSSLPSLSSSMSQSSLSSISSASSTSLSSTPFPSLSSLSSMSLSSSEVSLSTSLSSSTPSSSTSSSSSSSSSSSNSSDPSPIPIRSLLLSDEEYRFGLPLSEHKISDKTKQAIETLRRPPRVPDVPVFPRPSKKTLEMRTTRYIPTPDELKEIQTNKNRVLLHTLNSDIDAVVDDNEDL